MPAYIISQTKIIGSLKQVKSFFLTNQNDDAFVLIVSISSQSYIPENNGKEFPALH